ncbi:MAG: cobalamin B12-binding domain-containing protein [Actinomycetes bacterium]|mgnify:CR=1 FL=1|jgi:methylmalonyl-CoA mutase cobalamin-binding subunit|nr:methionine synthase [Acidimicrobiia bacterium]
MTEKLVLGAAIGDCVHVAGILNFLAACRRHGYRAVFLGPATPVERLVEEAKRQRPEILAVSYRLTPEAAERLFGELDAALRREGLSGIRTWFGGPSPVAEVARRSGVFDRVFGDRPDEDIDEWLTGEENAAESTTERPRDLLSRRRMSGRRPLIRHHFGLPSLERTAEGIRRIAEAGVVDVISLAPDQNAQEHFFRPERMDPSQDGAGGVPVRTPDDFRLLYEAAQRGNYPLLRCYAGTNDLVRFGRMLHETIRNAWCAIPVFWYSELDGRSERSLEDAIAENQELVSWSAANGIPVERNDQNQWGLRAASDTIQVAAAGLAARLSAAAGVDTYVLQMMLNTPAGISPAMDIAKMEAMHAVVQRRASGLTVLRELRAGLFSLPSDEVRALGQLASATRTAMALEPDILHVVGHTEADHAIEADELITSCTLVRQVVDDALLGLPDPLADPAVAARRDRLIEEAEYLLDVVAERFPGAMEGDAEQLGAVVRTGLFDAPYLVSNPAARGATVTVVDGGCDAVHPETGDKLDEATRIAMLD